MTLSRVHVCHSGGSLGFNPEAPKALLLHVVLPQMLFGVTKSAVKETVTVLMARLEP